MRGWRSSAAARRTPLGTLALAAGLAWALALAPGRNASAEARAWGADTPAQAGGAQLPSWNDGRARQAIQAFVERVTREGGPDYVAPPARIAVFDNDGTLWAEQPMYVQLAFVLDRVKALGPAHPEWKTTQPFKAALDGDAEALAAAGERGLLNLVMATHAGTTTEEFDQAVSAWIAAAGPFSRGFRS